MSIGNRKHSTVFAVWLTLVPAVTTFMFVPVVQAADANDARALIIRAAMAKERAIDSGRVEDWELALALFQEAHAARASATTAYEIGFAANQLHRDDTAFEAYSLALKLGLSGTARIKASQVLAERESRRAQLEPQCPKGSRVLVRGLQRGELSADCIDVTSERLEERDVPVAGQRSDPSLGAQALASKARPVRAPEDVKTIDEGAVPGTTTGPAPSRPVSHLGSMPARGDSARYSRPIDSIRQVSWLLVGAGTSVAVMGAMLGTFSNWQIREARTALSNACLVQLDGPDSCRSSRPGLQSTAQSHSNSIATWQTVRTSSWIGAGVGAAALLSGVVSLVVSGQRESTVVPAQQFSFEIDRVGVTYQSAF